MSVDGVKGRHCGPPGPKDLQEARSGGPIECGCAGDQRFSTPPPPHTHPPPLPPSLLRQADFLATHLSMQSSSPALLLLSPWRPPSNLFSSLNLPRLSFLHVTFKNFSTGLSLNQICLPIHDVANMEPHSEPGKETRGTVLF